MSLMKKISVLKLSVSFAVLMSAATPNAMASFLKEESALTGSRASSSSSLSSKKESAISPKFYSELETAFPRHFQGISAMSQPDLMRDKNLCDLKTLMGYSPDVSEKLGDLHKALLKASNPVFKKLVLDIEKALSDKESQTVLHYIFFLGKSALLASNKTEEERQFFNLAGFSSPYKHIDLVDPGEGFWTALQHLSDEDETRGDFQHVTHKFFYDPTDQMEKLLDKGSFSSNPFFMLMTRPKEDIFGFFALALTYYKGHHPVPVTLSSDGGELHGMPMSPWGKFCHDLAHSEVDPADHSVEQFANNILNLYQHKLKEQFKDFSKEDKAKFSVKEMIPAVAQFALEVHAAYRQSLVDILEASIGHFKIDAGLSDLPPEFEAFSAAAFLDAHEESSDMSGRYATSDLAELLQPSRSKTPVEITPQKEEGGASSSSSEKSEESVTVEKEQNLFSTSFVTGETPFTDEEIFDIVKTLPLSAYRLSFFHFGSDQPINADEISDYSVTRNKFYIEVSIDMFNGQNYLFRKETSYSRTLNLSHDREILLPASAVLEKEYGYKIPVVPSLEDEDYEAKVAACDKALREGMKHLHDIFTKTASIISEEDMGDDISIADHFAVRYTKALRSLTKNMPSFIKEGEGGLQGFLIKATSKETILNPYGS